MTGERYSPDYTLLIHKLEINTNDIDDFYTLWADWEQFVIGAKGQVKISQCATGTFLLHKFVWMNERLCAEVSFLLS